MCSHPQSLRNLCNRIAALDDLRYRVPFEILFDITRAHYGCLASKLGTKMSTMLGAIHYAIETHADNVFTWAERVLTKTAQASHQMSVTATLSGNFLA